MKTAIKPNHVEYQIPKFIEQNYLLKQSIEQSWKLIAPFWPLKNLIAVNPLQGLEDLPFEQAIIEGNRYFQQQNVPKAIEHINRETIKWMQVLFDEGQATIRMPLRKKGLYLAWLENAKYDDQLHENDPKKKHFFESLPLSSEKAIEHILSQLNIKQENYTKFLSLMLTTLPGWASYVVYCSNWQTCDNHPKFPASQADYLAIRLAITYFLWPNPNQLIEWFQEILNNTSACESNLLKCNKEEKSYQITLLKDIAHQEVKKTKEKVSAQIIFCIDVRSEPFRRALESTGDYETYGFAGFFGLPLQINDVIKKEAYSSCPVLVSAKHSVKKIKNCSLAEQKYDLYRYNLLNTLKSFYQSLKYTFISPFALVEMLGLTFGALMGLRTFSPNWANQLKTYCTSTIRKPIADIYLLDSISFEERCTYAENALKMIGLTKNFAPLVIFCGHGSTTQNNAYASALDCGACGANQGNVNACIMAQILNDTKVRDVLSKKGISIPKNTYFIGALHDTTTDEVTLYSSKALAALEELKQHLHAAREINSHYRSKLLGVNMNNAGAHHTSLRSKDWAQVRPEWGLARNAAFIIAPRDLTKKLDLGGRCFLHSYDYQQDPDVSSLTTILTAPVIVAQWINMQYLFSTLDNVAYGAGNKITKNITGKIGIMQGNASDLMTGLPLQSVYHTDDEPYHVSQRLQVVVYGPRTYINKIISKEAKLQNLFKNGWLILSCIEPSNHHYYQLERDLTWLRMH